MDRGDKPTPGYNYQGQRGLTMKTHKLAYYERLVPELIAAIRLTRVTLSVWSLDPDKSPNTILSTLIPVLDKALADAKEDTSC